MANFTRKTLTLAAGLMLSVMSSNAQQLREDYIDAGKDTGSEKFQFALQNWQNNHRLSKDDNFYISRVKPHVRFRNAATQVRDLTAENDKKLIAWIPVSDPAFNALPNGVFDSEVFSMWSYVTHYGDWTASLGRIPAAFLDAAHKNGVGVSGVASIPNASLSGDWLKMITAMGSADAELAAKFFRYYGINGMGYNSEFYDQTGVVEDLRDFHADLVKAAEKNDPLFENFWYDGTNDGGGISFDQGLGSHNEETFGDGENRRTSLFFNYNWNKSWLMDKSVEKAVEMGRDPLDLYCGVNMQGGEPRYTSWSLLPSRRLSIGLWGAHSNNMFWESRGEKGSNPDVKQNTYLQRIERYFTGGTRNPANCPSIVDRHACNADNFAWHGMSTFMTARSALSWNLSEEPFITYFNLGNGKYFNLEGKRQNNNSWYNVGMQDYLPTWRWWFASKLLGNKATDVPENGLDANFTWDDAYFGGSTIRLTGSTADEYLHLFKTEYALKAGDVITFKYKLAGGTSDIDLLLSAKGSETSATAYNVLKTSQKADDEEWIEKKFVVGTDFDSKDLALVALHFKNAKNLSLLLGEFSIVRGTSAAPAAPVITSSDMLYNSYAGMDAKLIWNMENNKAVDEPCYNIDVKTSYFKLYAQEEGQEPVLCGTTTSWAGMFFSIPVTNKAAKVRLGVSAVALDQKSESQIAWTEYNTPTSYTLSDDIQIDKTTIKPGEKFTMGYVDPEHKDAAWELLDEEGNSVYSGNGKTVTVENGLENIGSYTLKLTGDVSGIEKVREYPGYVQITDKSVGALPEIYTLTANDSEEPISIKVGDQVTMKYTAREANGASSQGVDLQEYRYGAKCADLGLTGAKSFSVAFWLKINELAEGETQLFSVANKLDAWPKTDWGWIWVNVNQDGSVGSFSWRGADKTSNNEIRYKYANSKLPVGTWAHVALTFDYNAEGALRGELYINGKKQEITGWNRQANGDTYFNTDPGYQANPYNITDGQVIAVGGDAHGRSGIKGAIDNLQIWDHALTADEVQTTMGTIDSNNVPAGIIAFWDNEKAANDDFTFASVGQKKGVQAGLHAYTPTGDEGQGEFVWVAPKYTSGCPFITGTAYQVETVPTWSAPKADIISQSGNDTEGEAVLSYEKEGVRNVTLTLANSLGKDQRVFSAITIGSGTGIDQLGNGELKAYTVGEDVIVEFAEAGNYDVQIVNVAGQAQARKAAAIAAGGNMQVRLANAGAYILTVKKDGKVVRTMKLIRK